MADTEHLVEPFKTHVLGLVAESAGRVYVASGYRTLAEQQSLYVQNCGSLSAPASACHPATAKPGTSHHEQGRAVDFGGDLDLAAKLAPKYGLVRTVPSEAWHYEDSGASLSGDPSSILTDPFGTIGSVGDALAAIVAAFGKLSDPHVWVRVLMVVGGLMLVGLAFVALGFDTRTITGALGTPGAGELRGAAGAGEAIA